MAPPVVIFDMDDVLCRYDLGKRLRRLSALTGKMPRDIRAAIWDSGFEDAADTGVYPDPDEYLAAFSERLGHPLSREEWIEARRGAMTPWPDMLALARTLGGQARLALYSNNGPLAKAELHRLFPEAAAIFAERYFSCDLATKKPDPDSYRKVLALMGAAPEQCWFIDDKRSNVVGARMAGLAGHHFRSHDALAEDARSLGFAV